MRRYELMLLLRPDLEDDKLQSAVEKVTRAIVNGGGSLSKVSPWGKRRLAYDIGHFREASYFLIHFDIQPDAVREIERGMLISEEILRHLVTVLEDRAGTPEDDQSEAATEGQIYDPAAFSVASDAAPVPEPAAEPEPEVEPAAEAQPEVVLAAEPQPGLEAELEPEPDGQAEPEPATSGS